MLRAGNQEERYAPSQQSSYSLVGSVKIGQGLQTKTCWRVWCTCAISQQHAGSCLPLLCFWHYSCWDQSRRCVTLQCRHYGKHFSCQTRRPTYNYKLVVRCIRCCILLIHCLITWSCRSDTSSKRASASWLLNISAVVSAGDVAKSALPNPDQDASFHAFSSYVWIDVSTGLSILDIHIMFDIRTLICTLSPPMTARCGRRRMFQDCTVTGQHF